ncbi:hypothetical protein EVAR_103943_1 [Eumeta japonica]|uniref:Uncharacterized protein n=1 Tax=Eumeta variegata TaxID=151549 RepID=A0A4C1YFT5_EUMVA|nr:hypothetical protein EVAR_103943_1 [Eumeta japonica]
MRKPVCINKHAYKWLHADGPLASETLHKPRFLACASYRVFLRRRLPAHAGFTQVGVHANRTVTYRRTLALRKPVCINKQHTYKWLHADGPLASETLHKPRFLACASYRVSFYT